MPDPNESAIQAAHAWSAAQIRYALHSAGQHMHPDTRAEVADIIARLNARAERPDRPQRRSDESQGGAS